MALTKAAKKGLGLLITLAVVGGGIYAFQHMPKKQDAVGVGTTQQPVEQPQVAPQPEAPTQQAAPQPAVEQQPQVDASTNRGMQFLLNQGKK